MMSDPKRRDHHAADRGAFRIGQEGRQGGEDPRAVSGRMLPGQRVVALPDVVEAGLLEVPDPLDVVPDIVAEAFRGNAERNRAQTRAPFPPIDGLPLSSLIRRMGQFVKQAAPGL